ncbi:hypothetical protein NFI96_000776 [Prochilodus magdalenae]|nr:hypothetical protein NFI96_000776 [Prochilodus magdalenae]
MLLIPYLKLNVSWRSRSLCGFLAASQETETACPQVASMPQGYRLLWLGLMAISFLTPLAVIFVVKIIRRTDKTEIKEACLDLQRAVVSSMSHPVSAAPLADGCTTQDYLHTDRYHDCP